jgi:hypothetical protein
MAAFLDDWRLRVALAGLIGLAGCGGSASNGSPSDASTPFDATQGDDAASIDGLGDGASVGPPGKPPAPGRPSPEDASMLTNPDGLDGGGDADAEASVSNLAPQSGPFLDGSCPFDASASLDGAPPPDDTGDADVPQGHRPAALCCPVTRDPGGTCAPDAAIEASSALCSRDSDCTKGTNGRCLVYEVVWLMPPPGSLTDATTGFFPGCESQCTYDECFSDDDCPGHAPCDCRASPYLTNVCRTASRCSVDTDCGPGGFCTWNQQHTAAFCHHPGDACLNDRDCVQGEFGARCTFFTSSSQWQCIDNPPHP